MSYDGSAWNRLQSVTTPENVMTSYSFSPGRHDEVASSGLEITETRGPVVRKVQTNRNGQFVRPRSSTRAARRRHARCEARLLQRPPRSAVYGNTYPTASGSLFEVGVAAAEDGPSSFTNGLQSFWSRETPRAARRDSAERRPTPWRTTTAGPGAESFSSGPLSVSQSLTWASDDPFSVESMTDKVSGLGDLSTTYSYGTNGQVGGWVTNGEST